MHSSIVNGYQLLCDAHTVLEPHRETAAVLFHFFFLCVCHSWQSLFLFLGASIFCVNNQKRTADIVLWFPDKTSVYTHTWYSALSALVACWCCQVMSQTVNHIKGYINLCSYAQWYCKWVSAAVWCSYCAWTTLGNCSFFLYSLSSFSTFSFYVFVPLTIFSLDASLVCVNNLKRTADLVLWFPDRTSVCTHPWRLYNLIVLKASLNTTKLTNQRLNDLNVSIALEALLN